MAKRETIFEISKAHDNSKESSIPEFDLENTFFHWSNKKLCIVPTNQNIKKLDRDEIDKILLTYIRENNQLLAEEQ